MNVYRKICRYNAQTFEYVGTWKTNLFTHAYNVCSSTRQYNNVFYKCLFGFGLVINLFYVVFFLLFLHFKFRSCVSVEKKTIIPSYADDPRALLSRDNREDPGDNIKILLIPTTTCYHCEYIGTTFSWLSIFPR